MTEEQVRRWARDEYRLARLEEQKACLHARSGTLHDDGRLTCDQCGKTLTEEDGG